MELFESYMSRKVLQKKTLCHTLAQPLDSYMSVYEFKMYLLTILVATTPIYFSL